MNDREKAQAILAALGGKENVAELESCITRLRLVVNNPAAVDEKQLKALGAVGVMKVGKVVQVILGTSAERIEQIMKDMI
ncbi:glucose-like phosphotransferase system IIB component [Symbiobacterium terraclitae]|uniref:Glucose-like phosphotransferase system IIB component n=1 Tax=Symbiobacterium terraclitae TaxID=557451 RepID=A0ABS4JZ06_9FIRM|nr:glucose-like phosphotransferase system IIB component [Symbiobacterium terraclitae]